MEGETSGGGEDQRVDGGDQRGEGETSGDSSSSRGVALQLLSSSVSAVVRSWPGLHRGCSHSQR